MLFSVIVPVYNVADYLPKCMESLFRQSCDGGWEILLVDDGSTDGRSGALCDEYAALRPELVRVIHRANGGLGAARNTGMEAARGDYFFFLDSDDWLADDALSLLQQRIAGTHADLYIFNLRYVSDGGTREAEPRLSGIRSGCCTLAERPELLMDPPSAVLHLCRRSLFLDTGIRFPGRVWYEDLSTTPKLLLRAKSVVLMDEALYNYYLRQGSIMRNANLRRNLEILDALESVRADFLSEGALERYRPWLSVMAVDNVTAAARRVLTEDPGAEYLPEFLNYVKRNYPDYRKEPLLPRLGRKKLVLLKLLEGKHYRLARAVFRLAGKIKRN